MFRGRNFLWAVFSRARVRQWLLGIVGAILVMEAWRMELGKPHAKEMPDTVEFHFERLKFLHKNMVYRKPKSLKEYVRPATISWFWNGQPTIGEQMQEEQLHADALVRLGFFEEREFKSATNNAAFVTKFFQQLKTNGIMERATLRFEGSNQVIVTGRKEDFPAIKKVIDELNAPAK